MVPVAGEVLRAGQGVVGVVGVRRTPIRVRMRSAAAAIIARHRGLKLVLRREVRELLFHRIKLGIEDRRGLVDMRLAVRSTAAIGPVRAIVDLQDAVAVPVISLAVAIEQRADVRLPAGNRRQHRRRPRPHRSRPG
mgnify:CR=1 FL=1